MRTVQIHNDALGIEAFKAVSDAIRQQTTDKTLLLRLSRIAAVFDHRTTIAIIVEDTPDRWSRQDVETRLAAFKAPTFFIEAARAVLDEVKGVNQAKALVEAEKRKARQSRYCGWATE